MAAEILDTPETVTPTESDARLAREAVRTLSRLIRKDQPLVLAPRSHSEDLLQLPSSAAELLLRILHDMAAGRAVTVLPTHTELTTQQAADLLGVSRPFVVKEVDAGRLASRKVGSHRRVLLSDLIDYKRKMETARQKSLDELAAEGQRLAIGY